MGDVPRETDVLIIGGGPGGLMIGALLASEGRTVTVLEGSDYVGGRSATIKQEGFTFEIGPHAAMDYRLRDVYKELGLTFERGGQNVGWHLRWDNRWRRFQDFYNDERETHDRVVEAMREMTYEDLHLYDHISAMDWVDQFAPGEALRFAYEDLAVNELVLTKGDECSAGDWIYGHKIALDAEGRFGWADYPVGGYSAMLQPLVDYIPEHGGQIFTGMRVSEVLVEDGRVAGVRYLDGPQTYASHLPDTVTVKAETVIFSGPVGTLNTILPTGHAPGWFHRRLDQLHEDKTVVFGFYEGHEGSLMGPEIRTWWGPELHLPAFAISVSEYEPTTAPEGQSFTWFGVYLDPKEMRYTYRLDELRRAFEKECHTMMPELDSGQIFRTSYASPNYSAVAQRPGFTGMFKPEVKVPEIEGLYLVGDGVRGGRGVGVENVAGSVFRCREAIVEQQTMVQLAAKLYDVPPTQRQAA